MLGHAPLHRDAGATAGACRSTACSTSTRRCRASFPLSADDGQTISTDCLIAKPQTKPLALCSMSRTGVGSTPTLSPLFEPVQIAGVPMGNRVMMAPMGTASPITRLRHRSDGRLLPRAAPRAESARSPSRRRWSRRNHTATSPPARTGIRPRNAPRAETIKRPRRHRRDPADASWSPGHLRTIVGPSPVPLNSARRCPTR